MWLREGVYMKFWRMVFCLEIKLSMIKKRFVCDREWVFVEYCCELSCELKVIFLYDIVEVSKK